MLQSCVGYSSARDLLLTINDVLIEDTFAEAFPMPARRASVETAMRTGIRAACQPGVVKITAGNFRWS